MPRRSKKVFREGKVHVMAEMCPTCIFRPGNLMNLESGRVKQMVRDATKAESCIPCHETTHGGAEGEAICRGFYEKFPTLPIRLAEAIGSLIEVQGKEGDTPHPFERTRRVPR